MGRLNSFRSIQIERDRFPVRDPNGPDRADQDLSPFSPGVTLAGSGSPGPLASFVFSQRYGKKTVKVFPSPTVLFTSIQPFNSATHSLTIVRPSPVPPNSRFEAGEMGVRAEPVGAMQQQIGERLRAIENVEVDPWIALGAEDGEEEQPRDRGAGEVICWLNRCCLQILWKRRKRGAILNLSA